MAIANKISALLERAYTEGGRQLNQAYGELLQGRGHWGEICSVIPTNSERLDLSLLLDVPKYQEEIGGVQFGDLVARNLVITPRRFSAGISQFEDEINDDNLGIVIDRIQDLGNTPEDAFCEHTFLALQAGTATTTYGACYDSGAFFATHTVGSTTFSNYNNTGSVDAWYLLDCSKGLKPIILVARKDPDFEMENPNCSHRFETGQIRWKVQGRMWMSYGLWQRAYCDEDALTDTRLWADIRAMREFQDENGRFISTGPTHLVVPPVHEQVARELLERLRIQGTAAAPSNEPVQNLNLKLIVDPYLSV